MSASVYRDSARTQYHTAAREYFLRQHHNPDTPLQAHFYCSSNDCSARMHYCQQQHGMGYFSADASHPHSPGCPYGSSSVSDFQVSQWNLDSFDFEAFCKRMEGENIPTATVTAGSNPSGSKSAALPTPRTLLQVYAACKQLDLDFRFGAGHRTVGGILLDSRSLYRYFSNPFIGLLGFHIVEAYPAPMYYSSGKHSFYFEVCSASRKMHLTVEVPDPELFKSIRSKLFKRYSASAANGPRPATILFGKWSRIDETHSSMQLTSPKQLHILR